MAAVGSAVGLGNIWRFPYICGKYGGGAFLLVYLCFVFGIGMVLMMSEFIMGRRSRHTPMKAFASLSPKHKGWRYVGLLGIITCFFILSQYLVISGWTLSYFFDAITGRLATMGQDSVAISDYFNLFSTSTVRPVVFLGIFALLTAVVILCGVQKGIEAVSKVLMPVLVVLLAVLCVRSLTLPGASKGLEYLFSPDFTKLTAEGVLAAMGQAMFSLSVGMGVMIVYGSYIPADDKLLRTSMWITASDVFIAVLAGVAIFPAVFSCGLEPAGGPGLSYCVLPNVFNSMGGVMGIVLLPCFSSCFPSPRSPAPSRCSRPSAHGWWRLCVAAVGQPHCSSLWRSLCWPRWCHSATAYGAIFISPASRSLILSTDSTPSTCRRSAPLAQCFSWHG